MDIKIMLVDDHQVVRKGLRYFLETDEDLSIVAEASHGREACYLLKEVKPDVILMDLVMPIMDGIEATKIIRESYPEVKILILSSYSEHDHVIPALQAGANGYQLKDIEPEELVETIKAIYSGESKLHDKVTKFVLTRISHQQSEEEKNIKLLTKREVDVLKQIASGKSNKEIAQELYITEKTVKTHLSNIFSKLEVSDRTQAALFAIKHKIVKF
ncbi:putative response regulator [Bacillus sp. TS-2]|nr:putative response regulator [Bacillus sp. TS-2]